MPPPDRAGQWHRAHIIAADVADPDQVFAVAERVEADIGPIDVWVDIAFTCMFAPFDQITPTEYRRVTKISYLGYIYAADLRHRALPRVPRPGPRRPG